MSDRCVYKSLCSIVFLLAVASPAWADPVFERVSAPGAAQVKKPFEVAFEMRWRGAADAYVALPLEYEGPDWADIELGASEAFVRDGENVVAHRLVLTPREIGVFEVPEVRAGYLTAGDLAAVKQPDEVSGNQEPERQIPKLRVSGFTVEVRRDLTILWIALALVGAGVLIYVGGAGVFVWKRAREDASEAEAAGNGALERMADARAAGRTLHEAKRCRVEGDPYGFYSHLARAAEELGPAHDELAGVLQARAQKIGFQGYTPTEDDMASDYRAVARALKQSGDEESPVSP